MAQLEMDRFTAWVRDTGRGCLSDADMDAILQVECDIDGDGKFHFTDDTVQRDWEVWQAALVDRDASRPEVVFEKEIKNIGSIDCEWNWVTALRPMSTAPNDGTPILVRLERKSLNTFWHVARLHPNVQFVGHYFAFDCAPMIGWLPLPVIAETEVPDASK